MNLLLNFQETTGMKDGFSDTDSFSGSVIAMFLMDKAGRRGLLLGSFLGMVILENIIANCLLSDYLFSFVDMYNC